MDQIINQPLVTVLMPVYNSERYVKQAIQSVLEQTCSDFELLVINDGSSDKSEQIILSFDDKRIRYIKNEKNLGLITTLNKGLDMSKGKFIARMDADDIALPMRLERQSACLLDNPNIGILGSAYTEFNENGKRKTNQFLNNNDELKCILLFNSCMGHPTVMFRTNLIRQQNLQYDINYKHAEDYELWVRAIQITKFSNYASSLLLYRLHDKQISKRQNVEQKASADKVRMKMLNYLNLNPTDNELKIHNAIGNKQKLKELNEIEITEKWFKKIIEANEQVNFINEKILTQYLSLVFQDVCANSSLGMKAYFYFNHSELRNYSPKSFIFKLKFFIKCLIR